MYQQQRINTAGRISKLPLSSLRPLFDGPEQFAAFLRAAQEGRLSDFLSVSAIPSNAQTREALAQYPALLQKLQGIRAARTAVLEAIAFEDTEALQEVWQKEVLEEWAYLQTVFEDSFLPQHRKALQLLAEEIRLLDEFAPQILTLAPDAAADNLPPDDGQLIDWLEREEWSTLGRAILQHLYPRAEGTLLELSDPIKPLLLRTVQKHISTYIKEDPELSEANKQELFSSHQAFLNYVARQDDPIYPAFIALTLDAFNQQFRHSGKFLATLKELAGHYGRINTLEAADYAVLIRLYEFILDRINWLYEQAVQSDNPEFVIRTELDLHLNLGRWYGRVWEVEAAVLHYKEAAFLAFAQDWQREFEGALFRLLECYQKHLREEQLSSLIPKILAGDAGWMGIPEPVSLSRRLRESLEVLLLEGWQNRNVAPDAFLTVQQHFQTNIGLEMARQMHQLQQTQVGQNKPGLTIPASAPLAIAPLHTPHEHWLDELEYTAPEGYRERLQVLDRQALELWPPHRLHLRLHQARLQRLQGKDQAVGAFNRLLPEMERWPYFTTAKKAYWQVEFISAIALCVGRKPLLLGSVDQAVQQVLIAVADGFQEAYPERNALPGALDELDRLTEALLLNVKRVRSSSTRQGLLRTLWQVLLFRQQFVIGLWGKPNKAAVADPAYQEALTAFSRLLQQLQQATGQYDALALYRLTRELRARHFAPAHSRIRLSQDADPDGQALLFSFLQKEAGHRQALVLAFLPQKDQKQGEGRYALKILDHFEKVDKRLQQIADLQDWKALLDNTDFIGALYDQLLEFGPSVSESRTLHTAAQELTLYADPILMQLPVEALQIPEQPALGEWKNVRILLKQARLLAPPAMEQGLLFVGARLPAALQDAAFPSWQIEQAEELEDALAVLQPALMQFALPILANPDLPAETTALAFPPGPANIPGQLSYFQLLNLDLKGLDLVILTLPEGQLHAASALLPLVQALLEAGASAVLANRMGLAAADSEKFLRYYYQQLLRAEPGEALRQSRLHFNAQHKHLAALWTLFT